MPLLSRCKRLFARPHLRLIALVGVIVPRRLRGDWRQEWEAELRYRETLLAEWDRLDWRHKLDLLWRSTSAFWDALWLQPQRLEDEMIQDLRYGVRMLVTHPGFTFVAVLTLALGIGANTAIFSPLDAVLLKTLPVTNPEQLVLLSRSDPHGSKVSSNISYPVFEQLREHNQVCSGMFTVLDFVRLNVSVNGQAEMVEGQLVSGSFHSVLGVEAILGRTLSADDDRIPGAHPVAVISYGYWQRRFGRDPAALGKVISLNRIPFTIVGVTPPEFFGVTVGISPDISIPLMMLAQVIPGETSPAESYRVDPLPHILARLNPGVTAQQASAALTSLFRQSLRAAAGSPGVTGAATRSPGTKNRADTGEPGTLRSAP